MPEHAIHNPAHTMDYALDDIDEINATPETEIHVYDWPVEIPRATDSEHWELTPETWHPDFAASVYAQQCRAHVAERGSSPVPMTFAWRREEV